MRSATLVTMLAVPLLQCACATQSPVDATPKLALDEKSYYTGSRLKKPTTERILRQVGNKQYQDERLVNSLGNDIANLPKKTQ